MATFGYTTQGASVGAPILQGSIFAAPGNGTVTQMSVYAKVTSGSMNLNVGIFNDSSGTIGTHIAHSTQQSISNTSFQQFDFTVSASIVSGVNYWLVAQGSDASTGGIALDAGGTNQRGRNATWTYNTWTDSPASIVYSNFKLSIYATYTPSSSVPYNDVTLGAPPDIRTSQTFIMT